MKKLISIILVFLSLFSSSALAAGDLKATEKNLILFPGDDTGYFFAKVENVGDEPVSTTLNDLVIFSDDDEIILSSSYISSIPSSTVIEPGEYLYVSEFLWDSALENVVIGDYKFSPKEGTSSKTAAKLPCEASIELDPSNSLNNYIHVTFTNSTGDSITSFQAIAAMYDANGNLIYVDSNSYSNIILHSGSTVTVKLYIKNDLIEYYQANSIEPTTVTAMVCYTAN